MEQLIGLRLRKEYNSAVCCHSVYLNCILSISWEIHVGLDELQAGIKIGRKNINNLR